MNQHGGSAADLILALGARGITHFVGLIDDVRVCDTDGMAWRKPPKVFTKPPSGGS